MNYLLGSIFLLAYLFAMAGPLLSADAAQRLRIAYASRSSSAMPLYVALQKGYFKGKD